MLVRITDEGVEVLPLPAGYDHARARQISQDGTAVFGYRRNLDELARSRLSFVGPTRESSGSAEWLIRDETAVISSRRLRDRRRSGWLVGAVSRFAGQRNLELRNCPR